MSERKILSYIPCYYKELYAVYADEEEERKFFKLPILAFAIVKVEEDVAWAEESTNLIGVVNSIYYLELADDNDNFIGYHDGTQRDENWTKLAEERLKLEKEKKGIVVKEAQP